jgi:TRAP-type mannitol/chloroaromatic compound transport system permease small subunit
VTGDPSPGEAGPQPALVRGIERFVDLVGRAASWLALAIVVLMATNVVLRYLFSYGSVWAQELEWHLLTPLIMFAVAYAYLKGDLVRVDVLYAAFSPRTKALVNLASALLCLAIAVIVFYYSVKYVEQSYSIDERSSDPGGLTHRWVLKAVIPLGFVMLALQSVAEVLKSWTGFRGGAR